MKHHSPYIGLLLLSILCIVLSCILSVSSTDTEFLLASLRYSCSTSNSFESVTLTIWNLYACKASSLILVFNILLTFRVLYLLAKRTPIYFCPYLILPLLPAISHLFTLNKYLVSFFCITEITSFLFLSLSASLQLSRVKAKDFLYQVYIGLVLYELWHIQPGSVLLIILPFIILLQMKWSSKKSILIARHLRLSLLVVVIIIVLSVIMMSVSQITLNIASYYLINADASGFSVHGLSTQYNIPGFFIRLFANFIATPYLAISQISSVPDDAKIIAVANISPFLFCLLNNMKIRNRLFLIKNNSTYLFFFMTLATLSLVPFVQTRYLLPFTPLLIMNDE